MSPHIVTLGCRLNTHESEVMKALAEKSGLKNAIIVNTCAVTAEAERQARQTIRALRKEHPDAYIIATGCAVQMRPQEFNAMPEIDRILGNDIKLKEESFAPDFPYRAKVGDIAKVTEADLPLLARFEGRARAFLQIQNGCNHRCAFCTIPLARGNSRSVPLGLLVRQTRLLLEQGIQEIVLTGVDLTSYGDRLPGSPRLGQMIRRLLAQVPELRRLRLSSLDSIEVDPDLYTLLVEEPRILPHIHLSLQAGHNTVLKAMRRRHTREDAIKLCQQLKQDRPEFIFGADFIVGFPGEAEEMFQQTLDLVDECDLTHLHVFPFSRRPGTVAETLPHQLPKALIKERAYRLRTYGQQKLSAFFASQLHTVHPVLVEQPRKGYTNDFSRVLFTHDVPLNTVIDAKITGYGPQNLIAEVADK